MFSFRLPTTFVAEYADRKAPFGFQDAAGNSYGEIVFLQKYSRKKPCIHGATGDEDECLKAKETWVEVCERVTNGTYSIQKDHAKTNRLPWNDAKAAASAKEFFDRLFQLKWTPPGRGLWMMGTPLVNEQKNSAALQNCAFISTTSMTKNDPSRPFTFLMEASMLGIGVGFDTKGQEKDFVVCEPVGLSDPQHYVIPDTREGWVESVRLVLDSYLKPNQRPWSFDYDLIRPEGTPIKTFGGTAAGPKPLIRLHRRLGILFSVKKSAPLDSAIIADIGNLIGVCVVSGNVRRSAELLMGEASDFIFMNLKNPEVFPERNLYSPDEDLNGWGWMSNNSVSTTVGADISSITDGIRLNGEPGVIWMDVTREYGRLVDPPNNKDWRAAGYNPCAEQSLESGECCTLVETFLGRHDTIEDFLRTLKFAYLYAKTVTLLPTHWEETNAIMQRNRRIGASLSGIADFADNHSLPELRRWMEQGYATIQRYDKTYSEWLGIRESIKTTTVKPSGTVSILAGSAPGVHWAPGARYFTRRVKFDNNDSMLPLLIAAGYKTEQDRQSPETATVVLFEVLAQGKRTEQEVSIYEKIHLAAFAQRYWSDNSVSVTVSFDPETEGDAVGQVLHMYDGQLKTVSFQPMGGFYEQAPFTQSTKEEWDRVSMEVFGIDLYPIYDGLGAEAVGESYCTTDACLIERPLPVA